MVCAAPEKWAVRASVSPDRVQAACRSNADSRDLSPNMDWLPGLPGLSPGCQGGTSVSKCLPERCPREEVTFFSPISLTTAAILPMMPPLEKLGFRWVGSGSSSGSCESEQGQGSWRETGMAEAQHCQDGA